jgi:riboflavin kinase/FMN adenylyltransferase
MTLYALGNFDGLHRGHAAVIARAVECAAAHRIFAALATFAPHPRRFFKPNDAPFLITSPDVRDEAARALGMRSVLEIPFDNDLAALSPTAFVTDILVNRLHATGVVVGADFCFGRDRAGTAEDLKRLGSAADLIVEIVAPVGDGEKYSSSRIRQAIRAGDMVEARRQLGRPWRIDGTVQHGDARGRTIEVPTANIELGDLVRPAFGVYAAWAMTADGVHHPAAVNIGIRPTMGGTVERVEAHLLDFEGDLYGQPLILDVVSFIRPEQTFADLGALKGQIATDIATVRRMLAS